MLPRKLMFLALACLFVLPAGADTPPKEEKPSRPPVQTEVMIFSDYFCPPCHAIEPYLESALPELDRLGVKVFFVDKPINALTPLFSKYYLYAINSADGFDEVLRLRHMFFDIAKNRPVNSEQDLVRHIREKNIRLSLFDVKPIFDRWNRLIQLFSVKSTPTCVISQPGQSTRTFSGTRDIQQAIDRLIKDLSPAS